MQFFLGNSLFEKNKYVHEARPIVYKKLFQIKNDSGENTMVFLFMKEQVYLQIEKVIKNSVNRDVNLAHFLFMLTLCKTEAELMVC